MKLNIGAGESQLDGYIPIEIKQGQSAEKLDYPDGSVDEVRASHILEHFPHAQVMDVLKEWVRVLKPGGVLKIAVPDFQFVAKQYLDGAHLPIQSYVMGGQQDEHDFHKCLFDQEVLSDAMRSVGLIGLRRWADEHADCASYDCSLNIEGTKAPTVWPKVAGVISVPRLGFNDFWACAYKELAGIMPLHKVTGAYWDQCLIDAIEGSISLHDPEWILTCDYDTIFNREQVLTLLDVAMRHPEADAIAPIQSARHHDQPLFTARTENGELIKGLSREELSKREVLPIESAHFGLTLIRASKLKAMPQPWFYRVYGKQKCDPDVQFWRNWKAAGNSLYLALRVPVGHLELMIRWPNQNFETAYQTPTDFHAKGTPEDIWR